MKILILTDGEYQRLRELTADDSEVDRSLRQKIIDALDMDHGLVMDESAAKTLRRVLKCSATFLWWSWSSLSVSEQALFDGNQAKFERISAWAKAT